MEIKMGTERQRRLNLNAIKVAFIEADKKDTGIEEKKLITTCCIDYGVTERKAKEYIEVLVNSGFIERDEFGLWLKDKSYKRE